MQSDYLLTVSLNDKASLRAHTQLKVLHFIPKHDGVETSLQRKISSLTLRHTAVNTSAALNSRGKVLYIYCMQYTLDLITTSLPGYSFLLCYWWRFVCSVTIPPINFKLAFLSRVSKSITEIAVIIMTSFRKYVPDSLQRLHPSYPPAVVKPISVWALESEVTRSGRRRKVGKSFGGEKPSL